MKPIQRNTVQCNTIQYNNNTYILLDVLLCSIAEYFYELTTSKNSQQYYTTKRLIRDLLSSTPNCFVRAREFRGECVTEVCEVKRKWREKSS